MTGKKHSVKVSILNEEYTIRTDTPPEHTVEVAQYLDRAIREVMSSGAIVDPGRAAILAAMRITSELLEARAAADEVTETVNAVNAEIRRLLPPAKRLAGARAPSP